MSNPARFLVALSLLLSLTAHTAHAGAAPQASFSRGFSSHAAAPRVPPTSSGFGTFGRRASAPPAAGGMNGTSGAAKSPGGFGSFSRDAGAGGVPAPRQSDSALSRQLGADAAQANALRTLDQRRGNASAAPSNGAANGQAAGQGAGGMQSAAPGHAKGMPIPQPMPQAPTTVIVNQDRGGGMGGVIAGAMIANSLHAHARGGDYPAPADGGGAARHHAASSGSALGTFLSLCVLAMLAFAVYLIWKRVRTARAAAAAEKPNYAFERN